MLNSGLDCQQRGAFMCGRYYIDQEEDLAELRKLFAELNERFFGSPALAAARTGEIFPTHVVPVIRAVSTDEGTRLLPDLMQWGFPQQFAGRSSNLLINARAETAAVKPTFRQAVQHGRVLVPATSFFEWQHPADGSKGAKMRLFRVDEPLFYMAGLAREFAPDPKLPFVLPRFVILTGAANPSVSPLHDRMPLVLPRTLLRRWLTDEIFAYQVLQQPIEAAFLIEAA